MDHLSLQKLVMQSLYLQNCIAKNKTQFNVDFFFIFFSEARQSHKANHHQSYCAAYSVEGK